MCKVSPEALGPIHPDVMAMTFDEANKDEASKPAGMRRDGAWIILEHLLPLAREMVL